MYSIKEEGDGIDLVRMDISDMRRTAICIIHHISNCINIYTAIAAILYFLCLLLQSLV